MEPYLTDWKNDSKQSDVIKANWNQATDSKKQCKRISWQWKNICDTKPTQLLREVGRKTSAYVFLSRFQLLFLKVMLKLTSISPVILGSP